MHACMRSAARSPSLTLSLCLTSPRSPLLCWTRLDRVIHGMDVLDAMEKIPVDKKDKPVHDITIKDVTIHANPIAEAEQRK
jgi:hypothetical protein